MHFDSLNWWAIKPWFFYQPFQPSCNLFNQVGLLPSVSALLEGQAWLIVPVCSPDARTLLPTWRRLFLHLLEWHFLGHLMCPLKYAEMSALCGGFSNITLLPRLVGKQLVNAGFIQMCQTEHWINRICKYLLLNSNRSHRIWFCIQGRDTLPSSLRLSM